MNNFFFFLGNRVEVRKTLFYLYKLKLYKNQLLQDKLHLIENNSSNLRFTLNLI